ncbi:MAG TPA: hypothetical protein VMT88_10630 [Actinomycetes bacterium]|nr:hypothetical protein [Actinomycetes bacterium]
MSWRACPESSPADLPQLSGSLGDAAGESMLAISKRLGHSTPEFTASVCAHPFEEEKVADASRRAVLLRPHPAVGPPVGPALDASDG